MEAACNEEECCNDWFDCRDAEGEYEKAEETATKLGLQTTGRLVAATLMLVEDVTTWLWMDSGRARGRTAEGRLVCDRLVVVEAWLDT